MGKRDIRTLEYFSDNRRFADLINARFFFGEQIVKPEELEKTDKELNYPETKNGKKIGRDNVMKWLGDTLLAIFVTEHQNEVDYHMVQRIMLEESVEYERQWKERRKLHLEKGDLKSGAEFLSGMKKGEKFCPVVTLVVYYGKEPYKGATSLHEMLEWSERTEGLKEFVTDYHINVFDYHNQDEFNEYHTEIRILFEFMRYASDKEGLKKFLAEQKKANYNVDSETYKMIAEMTNSVELLEYNQGIEGEEEPDMCQAITELIAEGKAEGKAESILELLEDIGEYSAELQERVMQERDFDVLKRWHKLAARVETIEEFEEALN